MNKKFKEMFDKVDDLLFEINQQAVKEGDEDSKNLSCYLLEIKDSHMETNDETNEND